MPFFNPVAVTFWELVLKDKAGTIEDVVGTYVVAASCTLSSESSASAVGAAFLRELSIV
jgi:hypothetical protein